MNIIFTFLGSLRRETFPESLLKMQLWRPKRHTKGVDEQKLNPLSSTQLTQLNHNPLTPQTWLVDRYMQE